MTILAQTRTGVLTLLAAIGWIAVYAIDVLGLWQERARERRHLMSLDDRALADVGLTRADVDREYRKPPWML